MVAEQPMVQGTRHRVPVSVLIPVRNEIRNIADCIRSVDFADEIVVVDSGSTDGTIDAAMRSGARVVQFAHTDGMPKKKNWALAEISWKHDWVLIVDADERITPALAAEIASAITDDRFAGYFINRRFYFLGAWLKHSGYYPSWNMRLFRHRVGRYERFGDGLDTRSGDNEVHEHVLLDGQTGYLTHDMLHFAYPTIDVWIEKHNRYSNWEAATFAADARDGVGGRMRASLTGTGLQRKRWLKSAARRLPVSPALRFLYHYVWRLGFLDGYPGWVMCNLLYWYELVSVAKAREISRANGTAQGDGA